MKKILFSFLIAIAIFSLTGCGNNSSKESTKNNKPKLTILVVGDSTISNYGTGLTYTTHNNVFEMNKNYQFVKATTPNNNDNSLADGTGSSFIAQLGDLLLDQENSSFSEIYFINIANKKGQIKTWTPDYNTGLMYTVICNESEGTYDDPKNCGEMYEVPNNFERIKKVVDVLNRNNQKISYVLFQQGKDDTLHKTSYEEYLLHFYKFETGLRTIGVKAPIYLARSSWWLGQVGGEVIAAQNEIINKSPDSGEIKIGPDMDILGSSYRNENSTFNEQGLKAAAILWSKYVR
jgi:hypothetical protein